MGDPMGPDPLFWKHQRTIKYDQQILSDRKWERRRARIYVGACIGSLVFIIVLAFFTRP